MNLKDKVLLFIPMYNCEKQIVRVLNQITEQVSSYIDEILVVDNRSTDNSINVVEEYIKINSNKITLVKNLENYGLGGSHKVAIKYAQNNNFDYLIVLHGDDQGSIEDLLPYLETGEYREYDCFLGSRFMKGSVLENYSKFRIFGNKVFNLIYSISAGKRITDLGSGLNMYRVSIFNSNYFLKCCDNLVFNYEMILKSIFLKQRIKFFPISWRESDQCSNVKLVKQSCKVLGLAVRNFFNKKIFFLSDNRNNKNYSYDCEIISRNFEYTMQPKKLHLVMPMCGTGSRFHEQSFKLPKPLIRIQGKPFFYWAANSLAKLSNIIDITFIVLQDHVDKYKIDNVILKYFPNARIVILSEVLNGVVLTCMNGIEEIHDDFPIIFNDCDHAFQSNEFRKFLNLSENPDGGLLTFQSNETIFSYVQYNTEGKIIGTAEKQVVSHDAICGAYYFKSKTVFLKYAKKYLVNCPYMEYFLSGVYNEMIKDKKMIRNFKTDFYLSFGTPNEFKKIKKSKMFFKI